MTISLDLILELLFLGIAVAIVAYLLPFVYIRNFGTALLVGILVSIFNACIIWALGQAGIALNTNHLTIAHLVLTTLSLLLADRFLTSFRVRHVWGAALFGLLVIVLNMGFHQLIPALS